jgi:hypothetical protein
VVDFVIPAGFEFGCDTVASATPKALPESFAQPRQAFATLTPFQLAYLLLRHIFPYISFTYTITKYTQHGTL